MPMPENNAIVLPWRLRIQYWATRTNREEALAKAIACGAPPAAIRLEKSPVSAITTQHPDYLPAATAFLDTLQTVSVVLRAQADRAFQPVNFHTRVGFSATPPVAVIVDEGDAKPVTAAPLHFFSLTPKKAIAGDVITYEAWDDVSGPGQQHLMRRLQAAVATGIDTAFFQPLIDTDTTSVPSSGPSALNAKADLRAAQQPLMVNGSGRYYWVCHPTLASKAATLATTTGADAFPSMSAAGGEMAGSPCVTSLGVAEDELYFIDAGKIAARADQPDTRISRHGTMEMSDAPSGSSAVPTATQQVSLWQANCMGFVAEARVGAEKLGDAVSVITGVDWGGA